MQLWAKAIDIIPGLDSRGRMPFSGVLTQLDQISDAPPAGSGGKKIIVSASAGRKALSSLIGMGVNSAANFDGHDQKTKIGYLASAGIAAGKAIVVEGFIYAKDFPMVAREIKAKRDALGFSFEAERLTVLDPRAAILTITELTFTGAAILLKDKAAYQTTSIAAARGEQRIKPMNDYVHQNVHPEAPPKRPFSFGFNGPAGLARTLDALGFPIPSTIKALAASNQPLGRSGMKISVYDLDQVLSQFDISVQNRLQLKNEMHRQGILA